MKVGGKILPAKIILSHGSGASVEGESRRLTRDYREGGRVAGKKSGLRGAQEVSSSL